MPSSPVRDPFRRYRLTPVINVSGTETVKGASPVSAEVLAAVNALVPHSVDMAELNTVADRAIARAFGAEAGLVAHCSAAGIVTAVAACMTGPDSTRAERLPDATGLKNEVILQRGHAIDYGGFVTQNIRLAGARVRGIGSATGCSPRDLAKALGSRTAAAVYVVSHHTIQTGLVDLATFCRICRRRGVPVIVDAAAEPEPRIFLRAGADLVITSMHKHFAGLTAATVAGRRDLVAACRVQEKGVARPMKVGKEAVISTLAALERWRSLDPRMAAAATDRRLARGRQRLGRLPGVTATLEADATSGLFSRLLLQIGPEAGLKAAGLAAALEAGKPSVFIRSTRAAEGFLQLDLRRISDASAGVVFAAIERCVRRGAGGRTRQKRS